MATDSSLSNQQWEEMPMQWLNKTQNSETRMQTTVKPEHKQQWNPNTHHKAHKANHKCGDRDTTLHKHHATIE